MGLLSNINESQLQDNGNLIGRNYWRKRLENIEPGDYFSTQAGMVAADGNAYAHCVHQSPAATAAALIGMAPTAKARHIVLLAAMAAFIQKYASVDDVLVFTPSYSDVPGLMPFRVNNIATQSFRSCLVNTKQAVLNDCRHAGYPLHKMFDMQRGEISGVPATVLVLDELHNYTGTEGLQPGIVFRFDIKDIITIKISYCHEAIDASAVQRIAVLYIDLLTRLISFNDALIKNIELISEEEKFLIVNGFNNTWAAFPDQETIVSMFEKQVVRTPAHKAVTFNGKSISYQTLNHQAAQMAHYLRHTMKVPRGALVAVMLRRELFLMPAIYGILKAGCAYLPIDPDYPSKRIEAILTDSGVTTIITRGCPTGLPAMDGLHIIDLNETQEAILSQPAQQVQDGAAGTDLAYVIYTSGSTGKPKGVAVEHRSVVNRLHWMQKAYPISTADVLLQKTPIVFDVSVWELFWWSFTGASLVVLQPDEEKDPARIVHTIESHHITTIHFVPSMLAVFLAFVERTGSAGRLGSLQYVFASGEALKPAVVNRFDTTIQQHTRLINLYGPTEATVDVSYYECNRNKQYATIPLGKPIDNIQLYVLNKSRQMLPIGVAGELYIAGVGLARGYLNKVELTHRRFIQLHLEENGYLYQTGDLAKWNEAGDLEYLGRIDEQVKIRGYRIEPGDIEFALLEHPHIKEALVTVWEKDNNRYLAAWYVSNHKIDVAVLRAFLAARLPLYMVPDSFNSLPEFPLTFNGKLNRKALPEPVFNKEAAYVPPTTPLQEQLVHIWAQVLGIDKEQIGINDTFFELGGNSFRIVELNMSLKQHLNLDLSLPTLFHYPTITMLVAFLSQHNGKGMQQLASLEEEVDAMHDILGLMNVNNT